MYERFQNIFDDELINEICYNGQLRNFEEDQMVVDIDEKTMDIIGDFGKCMLDNDVMIAFYDEK